MSLLGGTIVGNSECENCGRILMFSDTCTCPKCSRWKVEEGDIMKYSDEVFIPIEDMELNETQDEINSVLYTYGVPIDDDNYEVSKTRLFEESDDREGWLYKWKAK